MKKFFFFRSSTPNGGNNNNAVPLPSTDKQGYCHKPLDSRRAPDKSKPKKQISESQTFGATPSLRRSRSYSSGSFYDGLLGQRNLSCQKERNESPCSSSGKVLPNRSGPHSSRCRALTPERQCKAKCFEVASVQRGCEVEKPRPVISSRARNDISESSSNCSSNVSSLVLDRYIDGEEEERSLSRGNSSFGGKNPPRFQFTAPASPTDGMKQKPKSNSFREANRRQGYFLSKDWVENGFGNESPRKLARHVIEKLTQSHSCPKDPVDPITIEDIYSESLNKCSSLDANVVYHSTQNDPDEPTNGCHQKVSNFPEKNRLFGDISGSLKFVESEEDIDEELLRKYKDAEVRAMFLSAELEQENFLQCGLSVPALVQTIRNLTEEKMSIALDVSAILRDRIADRASAREKLNSVKAELDSRTRRLEKERNELQSALEKELDRRSSEWSLKLEKYQAEEHRLRERVRELAELNVSLQREVSSLSESEVDNRGRIVYSESQLKDLTAKVEETSEENQNLRQTLSNLQEKYKTAVEDQMCVRRNYEEKERECKDLHRSITRLLRTCSEQEKTINGLREGLSEEIWQKSSVNFDSQLGKLLMEQMRLTGVEQSLRKEVESYKIEVDSLRHENINLLQRLKGSGKESGCSTFRLDQELWDRVHCLQNQGLSFLKESTQLCTKLLECIKENLGRPSETKRSTEILQGLDGQFVIDSDVKLQGIKRGFENLTRSLQTVSDILQEKSDLAGGSDQENHQSSEGATKAKLKAENLLTSLLREKLYFKELEVEQAQAELAAAVRGNDILRCEVQNAMDNISCVTHKIKDLELQMIKKDDKIIQLQNDLQECTKELAIVRGVLPKVSEERDLMWEEVKQYSEKNMLLNSEVKLLKKKIEGLDEDILLKEGQITILKDALGKPFDLLASPDSTREFLLE